MMNKIRKLKEKKGFTLVELIVVIAIIAILTAVLVPLIGRWSTQASYTTLQDGAQTVSNSANAALNALVMKGKPCTSTLMVGQKGTGNLTVTVLPAGSDVEKTADDGDAVLVPMADVLVPMADEKTYVIKSEMETTLDATLPANCCFMVSIKNGAVDGVVYINSSDSVIATTGIASATVTQDTNFENAFQIQIGETSTPVGLSGVFMKEGTIATKDGEATMTAKS